MSVPEKMILLDFFITITKYFETIRADIQSTKLAIQAVGNERGVFEKAVVAVDAVLHPNVCLKIGLALEARGCQRWGSHQAFPELRFTLAPLVSSKGGV